MFGRPSVRPQPVAECSFSLPRCSISLRCRHLPPWPARESHFVTSAFDAPVPIAGHCGISSGTGGVMIPLPPPECVLGDGFLLFGEYAAAIWAATYAAGYMPRMSRMAFITVVRLHATSGIRPLLLRRSSMDCHFVTPAIDVVWSRMRFHFTALFLPAPPSSAILSRAVDSYVQTTSS